MGREPTSSPGTCGILHCLIDVRFRFALVLAALLLVACNPEESPRGHRGKRALDPRVSLIRLVANPRSSDWQYVYTCGWLSFDPDRTSLFVSEHDHSSGFTLNSVPVSFGQCAGFTADWIPIGSEQGFALNHLDVCVAALVTATDTEATLCAPASMHVQERGADGALVFTTPITAERRR